MIKNEKRGEGMAIKQKVTATAVGVWTGALLGLIAIGGYAMGLLDTRIDYKIDCKLLRTLLIIEEMATAEQMKRAEERYKLIINNER